MLQKNKSSRMALIKYGFSAPLFILMLILSSATVENNRAVRLINSKAEQVFFTPVSGAAEIRERDNQPEDAIPKKLDDQRVFKKYPAPIVDTVPKKDDKVFTVVEHTPGFPGGIDAFMKYLTTNIRYPADSRQKGIQGRVIISFIVEKDGSLTDIHIARGVADDIDREALRVIQASPQWIPGTQNGKLVRVSYTVPISFTLDGQPMWSSQNKTGSGENNSSVPSSLRNIVLRADTGSSAVIYSAGFGKPLYILDGKEITNLMTINPNDIESITILKDKTATALYGPKGVNGVVVIRTKNSSAKMPAKQ